MKKLSIIAVSAMVLAFASCQEETKVSVDGMYSTGQVDSIVDARLEELRMQMAAENDSIINVRSMELADSIIAARSGRTVTTSRTVKSNTGKKAATAVAPKTSNPGTIGNGKPKLNNNDGSTIGNGKPKLNNNTNENNQTIGNGKPKLN